MSKAESSNLLKILSEKKELLNEMLSLSEQQAQIIKSEEVEELENVLNNKDLIIEKINELDLKAAKLEGQAEDKSVLEESAKIKEILSKLRALDLDNNKNLSKAMVDVQEGLKVAREGKRAMENYGNSDPYRAFASQGGTLFIDQDS